MEVVDREPLEAEQDAEVVFKICQLRAAVAHGKFTLSAGTDKPAVPTRHTKSIAKGTSPADMVKYTDQAGD
jgi:nitrous oxide reductase